MNCPHSLLRTALCLLIATGMAASATADSLDLVNGDHYQGKVVSMTGSNIVFQSDVLGSLSLSRDKVARVNFGDATPLAVTAPAVPKSTNSATPATGQSLILQGTRNLSAGAPAQADPVLQQMRQQGVDPKLMTQVQEEIIGQGNPAATQKFNELMGGLMGGSISVADIRAQAQDSIQQIKDAKQQLGPDVGDMFDGYLSILESFVAETATNQTITASPPPAAAAPASTPTAGTP